LVLPWESRAWLAHAWLVFGYWIPALFTPPQPHARFERWLVETDARLGVHAVVPRSTHHLELAYLLCYPLVPASFAVVFALGDAADVRRYWVAVLVAGYACYGTLPWTAARPPRVLSADDSARRGIAWLNTAVLGRVSHNLTTFPSGHVAVSLAAALSVTAVHTGAGVVFLIAAIAIAVAAVAGRYHYLVDVLAGIPVGAAGWLVSRMAALV
jgi:membrane-associated phospholipid phosphatase